jgi:hypothetical protein
VSRHALALFKRTIGVGALMILAARPAGAGESDAEAQFNYGVSEMMAGRYLSGCTALDGSFHLDPRPGTLFTLAECQRKWGHTASALANYEEYLAVYSRMSPEQAAKHTERAGIATEARKALQAAVPRIAVRLPDGAPPDSVVERDEVVLSGPMLGAAIPVDPGEHMVRVKMPDGRTTEQKVTVVDGETRTIVVDMAAHASEDKQPPGAGGAAPVEVRPAQPTRDVPSHRPWIFATAGVGGAGIVAGAVLGGLAIMKKSTATSQCDAQGVCSTQEAADAGNAARGLANAETIALIVGGVGLAVAIVLAVTEPRSGGASVHAWGGDPASIGATW